MATSLNDESAQLNRQVADDFELLELMLDEIKKSPKEYQPTNYWAVYEKRFLPELFEQGLKDFRRRRDSILSSFGATDFPPLLVDITRFKLLNNKLTQKIPKWKKRAKAANRTIDRWLSLFPEWKKSKRRESFLNAEKYGLSRGAPSFREIEMSLIGNPADHLEIDGKYYSESFIYYYLRYCYCAPFTKFDEIKVISELGSGSGKQLEVIKKLHPHLTFLVFDIPPQLYVFHQYLDAVFPGKVIPYRETRTWSQIPNLEEGGIYLFGTWQFPLITNVTIDLFWNCASFQEMEPAVVANYLKYVNKAATSVYLNQKMDGKKIADKSGQHGVLEIVTEEDYRRGLPAFNPVDMTPAKTTSYYRLPEGYSDSYWVKQTHQS
jgi:putative sugar O-methyltransferase